MAEIILANNRGVALVDDEDYEWLSQFRWHLAAKAYACRSHKRQRFYMHREILQPAAGLDVDHINNNSLDNRRSNLRAVTHRVNLRNSGPQRNNTSGVRGVCWFKRDGVWVAHSKHNGRNVYLGRFADIADAAAAYEAFNASVTPPLKAGA